MSRLRLGILAATLCLVFSPLLQSASAQTTAKANPKFEFSVRDRVYLNVNGQDRLARIYQPAGDGPFPALMLVHGGGWGERDRTDGQYAALELAAAGIVVVSIDYRWGSEAPYPAAMQDVNYGLRWLKAHAAEFGSTANRVGLYGSSAGGHLAILAAIRPDDARYKALPLAEAPNVDAKPAFVISGWGVMYPLERLKRAEAINQQSLMKKHREFFGDAETHLEATPALILEHGEVSGLPPVLFFQGTKDQWTTVDELQRLAGDWRKLNAPAEVLLLEGERHTFLNNQPNSANSRKTIGEMVAFIKKYAGP